MSDEAKKYAKLVEKIARKFVMEIKKDIEEITEDDIKKIEEEDIEKMEVDKILKISRKTFLKIFKFSNKEIKKALDELEDLLKRLKKMKELEKEQVEAVKDLLKAIIAIGVLIKVFGEKMGYKSEAIGKILGSMYIKEDGINPENIGKLAEFFKEKSKDITVDFEDGKLIFRFKKEEDALEFYNGLKKILGGYTFKPQEKEVIFFSKETFIQYVRRLKQLISNSIQQLGKTGPGKEQQEIIQRTAELIGIKAKKEVIKINLDKFKSKLEDIWGKFQKSFEDLVEHEKIEKKLEEKVKKDIESILEHLMATDTAIDLMDLLHMLYTLSLVLNLEEAILAYKKFLSKEEEKKVLEMFNSNIRELMREIYWDSRAAYWGKKRGFYDIEDFKDIFEGKLLRFINAVAKKYGIKGIGEEAKRQS